MCRNNITLLRILCYIQYKQSNNLNKLAKSKIINRQQKILLGLGPTMNQQDYEPIADKH